MGEWKEPLIAPLQPQVLGRWDDLSPQLAQIGVVVEVFVGGISWANQAFHLWPRQDSL